MAPYFKEKLTTLRKNFFQEKYRFDQGNSFLVFLNFTMLVVSLVKQYNGSQDMILWYIVMGFSFTWLLGYFLDKVVKVQDAQERVAVKRSPIWKENFNHHNYANKKLENVEKRLAKIENLLETHKRNSK